MKHAIFFTLVVSICIPARSADRPNILFIAIDDMRDWVGYLGKNPQTRTPNIDRLAARGVAFSKSYCAAPVCNPSRAALMSGMRPSTTGVYENRNDWRTVVPPEKCLPAAFRNAGYYAAGAGKIYHGGFDRKSEWNDYLAGGGGKGAKLKTPDNDGVDGIKFGVLDGKDNDLPDWHIADYMIEQLKKKHDKPFFLACGFHKPHMPWNVPQKWFDMFPLDKIQLPPIKENDLDDIPPAGVKMARPQGDHAAILKSGRWKEAVQAYLATIAYCDMNVGRVLDALDKSQFKDNTIICFWSDHGWHLGEKQHWRKFALWEEATRSPFIWVVPGLTKPGQMCDRPVDFMCIYPTLTDLCGIPKPPHVEGRSIKPLLVDAKAPWSELALTTYNFKNHAVRSEDWRYIRYANGDEELYNNAKDPNEWTNLAKNAEFAEKIKELAAYMPRTDKPDIGNSAPKLEKKARKKEQK